MCTTQISDRFEWCVLEDRYTSDHSPIRINCLQSVKPERPTRYLTEKADWNIYRNVASSIAEYSQEKDIEESYAMLENKIREAAEAAIPKSSQTNRKRETPLHHQGHCPLSYRCKP